jgi:hypothetical protein
VSPEDDQYEIEFPEEDYLSEHDIYEVEDYDHYTHFFDPPVDIDWHDRDADDRWSNGEYNDNEEIVA